MSKFNKSTVIHKFKYEVLTQGDYKGLNEEQRQFLWTAYLHSLSMLKQITIKQAQSWRYPKKELKL